MRDILKKIDKFIIRMLCIVMAVIILLLVTGTVGVATFSGTSMNPTFKEGIYLVVRSSKYLGTEPKREDVITGLQRNQDSLTKYSDVAKRVIGLPNEHIVIKGHDIYIDGVLYDDPYGHYRYDYSDYYHEVTLADDEYFVMGDNRSISYDSRGAGPMKRSRINHIVVATIGDRSNKFVSWILDFKDSLWD